MGFLVHQAIAQNGRLLFGGAAGDFSPCSRAHGRARLARREGWPGLAKFSQKRIFNPLI